MSHFCGCSFTKQFHKVVRDRFWFTKLLSTFSWLAVGGMTAFMNATISHTRNTVLQCCKDWLRKSMEKLEFWPLNPQSLWLNFTRIWHTWLWLMLWISRYMQNFTMNPSWVRSSSPNMQNCADSVSFFLICGFLQLSTAKAPPNFMHNTSYHDAVLHKEVPF